MQKGYSILQPIRSQGRKSGDDATPSEVISLCLCAYIKLKVGAFRLKKAIPTVPTCKRPSAKRFLHAADSHYNVDVSPYLEILHCVCLTEVFTVVQMLVEYGRLCSSLS